MRFKSNLYKAPVIMVIVVLMVITFMTYFYNADLFNASAVLVVCSLVVVWFQYHYANKQIEEFVDTVGAMVAKTFDSSVDSLPISVVITDELGEVFWHNREALGILGDNEPLYGKSIEEILGIEKDGIVDGADIKIKDERYTLYKSATLIKDKEMMTHYLVKDTVYKNKSDEYDRTRPVVMLISIDSYDEALQGYKENERSQLLSQVEYHIEKFVGEADGLLVKNERDRYTAVLEEQYMMEIFANKFELLDLVRELAGPDRVPLTLSIGIGRNKETYSECEQSARQSLDMALGRGGDQAVVKTSSGFEFYGGVSKGVEKRTKVKTRIVAGALKELIDSSSNVVIMGHKFADLDSLGSATGLYKTIKQMGKDVVIAIDRQKNLVGNLIAKLESGTGFEDAFKNPQDLMSSVEKQSLLIVVDTHLVHIVESEQLYRQFENVVVIDHHRRMVGYIENAVIFYHEPYASSASEMVTELIQYIDDKNRMGRPEAEALLAGIMLDTKNFIVKTGVRTFEAAAFLRKQGADTVEVRKLFNSTMESYQQRSRLVSGAEVYKSCAIAMYETGNEDAKVTNDEIKIIAPQAADELLNIDNVDASFVMYEVGKGVNMSARSMGKMNVQVIMESLGGGGHQTMAAAQLENVTITDARTMLLEAIDKYFDKV